MSSNNNKRNFSREQSELYRHYSESFNKTEKITLTWNNLSYSILIKDKTNSSIINTKYKNKIILRNISGRATSGEMLAIMGPTG